VPAAIAPPIAQKILENAPGDGSGRLCCGVAPCPPSTASPLPLSLPASLSAAWTLWVFSFFTAAVLLSKQGYVTSGVLLITQSIIIRVFSW
jgi:hypothetical protein